nr:immunoglobulin heavy chain junction region [Macaca mulatta]MPN84305.1 immunoglobulin heavy chain junction region [Macaca mulatta]MPN84448.1 immunoglobulin heavy chain junction region [Macaca mulatta]MPN84458.1 immunoglobulin heavy chain junction region [Macaca mulatta]MPN84512.1 immunoglobulin heavy chain junction region [Macaca mulatta]
CARDDGGGWSSGLDSW